MEDIKRENICKQIFPSYKNLYPSLQKYIRKEFRDNLLTQIVSDFYITWNNNSFSNFFKKSDFIIQHIPCFLLNFLNIYGQKILNYQNAILENFKEVNDINILWDIHDNNYIKSLIKIKDKKLITYKNNISENSILEILCEKTFPEYKIFFPSEKREGERLIRPFIEANENLKKREDIENYFFTFWKISSLLYTLRAIDLHYENVLIFKNYPIFIDTECLFVPNLYNGNYWIETTGLVDDSIDNGSSLLGGYNPQTSYLIPILWESDSKPEIHRTNVSKRKSYHKVIFWHWDSPSSYKANYLDWFKLGKDKILGQKKAIVEEISSNTTGVRLLLRPTRVYYALIKKMIMDATTHNFSLNKIRYILQNRHFLSPIKTGIDNIIEYEIKCIQQGIIPSFYINIHNSKIKNSFNEILWELTDIPMNVWLSFFSDIEWQLESALNRIETIKFDCY